MIVDNFNLFKKIINPYNDDEFYFVQILIRGKDGHTEQGVNGSNKNRLIKFYTIKSVEHLTKVEAEIKADAEKEAMRKQILAEMEAKKH